VHEGPFSVSLRQNLTPLEVGNVLSVEPGYYRTDAFGIRIENLVYVEKKLENENGTFMGFVPLTLCPYSRRLIDRALLTAEERTQVDGYHRWVRATLAPHLAAPDRQWLQQATAPL
jgi:Xaa-Pro aminopeptidase